MACLAPFSAERDGCQRAVVEPFALCSSIVRIRWWHHSLAEPPIDADIAAVGTIPAHRHWRPLCLPADYCVPGDRPCGGWGRGGHGAAGRHAAGGHAEMRTEMRGRTAVRVLPGLHRDVSSPGPVPSEEQEGTQSKSAKTTDTSPGLPPPPFPRQRPSGRTHDND